MNERASGGLSRRRLLALCRKETFQIVRDPSSVLIAFVLPVLMLFIFGYGVNLDASRLRIGIVLEDDGVEAARLAAAFAGSPFIEALPGTTRDAMARSLAAGDVRGFVVVPSNFGAHVERAGAVAPVQVVTDGSDPNTATFVEAYARGAWGVWQAQRAARRDGIATRTSTAAIALEPRYWFNPSTVSRNFLVPGSIVIVMTVVGALLTSLVVAREWERGTMEALLSTSVSRAELLLSKLLPYYVLGLFAMALCVAIAVWVLDVPFRGSLVMLFIVTTFFLGSALGLGLLVSTLTRNQFNAAQAALNVAFLPAMMLSGFLFEIASMPPAVRAVTWVIPARYFVTALQTLFQAGDVAPIVVRSSLFLALAAAVFIGLTAIKTPRRLD